MKHETFYIIILFIGVCFAFGALAVSPDVFPKNPLAVPSPSDFHPEFEENINLNAPKYNSTQDQRSISDEENNNQVANKIFKKIAPASFPWKILIWSLAIFFIGLAILIFAIHKFKKNDIIK